MNNLLQEKSEQSLIYNDVKFDQDKSWCFTQSISNITSNTQLPFFINKPPGSAYWRMLIALLVFCFTLGGQNLFANNLTGHLIECDVLTVQRSSDIGTVSVDGQNGSGETAGDINTYGLYDNVDFAGAFPPGYQISEVEVQVTFTKMDSEECGVDDPDDNSTFDAEISMDLTTSLGTVNLIQMENYVNCVTGVNTVTVTFNQSAASIVSGCPTSGTFLPANGSLDDFIGLDPAIEFELHIGDNVALDILCVESFSVNVTAIEETEAPVINCDVALLLEENLVECNITSVISVTDNCDANPSITYSVEGEPISFPYDFGDFATLEITATDESGNSTDCLVGVIRYPTAVPCDDGICENGMEFWDGCSCQNGEPPVDCTPTITCPALGQVECTDGNTHPDATGYATVAEGCVVDIEFSDGQISGSCPEEFIRTWTATDACGRTSTCDQIISKKDVIPPTIDCPDDITIECSVSTDDTNITGKATAEDNCALATEDAITYVDSEPIGDCVKVFTRTWTATDACGNTTSCEQEITIEDESAPDLTCPKDVTVDCADLEANIHPDNTGEPEVEEICNIDMLSITYSDAEPTGDCATILSFERTWTATDGCGNTSTCKQTIYILDETPPTITCPPNIDVSCEIGVDPADTGMPTIMDDCNEFTFDFMDGEITGDCPQTLERTWTAIDVCDNESSCVQVINIFDNAPPVLSGIPVNVTVECDAVPPPPEVTATDLCDEELTVNFTEERTDGNCLYNYTLLRTWSAADNCGNEVVESQTITVQDTEAPVIICPEDITLACDASTVPEQEEFGFEEPELEEYISEEYELELFREYGLEGTIVAATATDNCGVATISYTDGDPTGICPVTFMRTWTATDECGNSASCMQTITLVDEEAPTITCPTNTEVSCDESLEPDNTGEPTVDDNCNTVTFAHLDDPVTGNCPQTLLRNWTATDACGNTSACTQTITIVDNSPPTIACPDGVTVSCDESLDPSNTGSATAEDNCNTFNITYADELTSDGCTQTYIRTWTATDLCGNLSSCTQNITVEFDVPPIIVCPDDIKLICLDADTDPNVIGSATATSACGSATVSYEDGVISGECPISFIRTWTATDACGNTATCEQLITKKDNVSPQLTCAPPVTIHCGESSDPEFTGEASAEDNCGSVEVDYSDGPITGVCPQKFIRTWTATDECGNISACEQMITIVDYTVPTIACPNVFVIACEAVDTDPDITGIPMAEDPCLADVFYNDGALPDDCLEGDFFVRTWTAVDFCGNQTSCEQKIYIIDETPPTITCPEDTEVSCEIGVDPADTGMPTAIDNCNEFTFDYMDGEIMGSCPETFVRTWTATDACGNVSSCDQVINIFDNTPPVLSGVPLDLTVECNAVSEAPEVTATDLCDEAVEVNFTEVSTDGDCPYNYTLLRTWSAADICGNEVEVSQTITVQDTEAPVIICPEDITLACDASTEPEFEENGLQEFNGEANNDGGKVYLRSNIGLPWNLMGNENAMDDVFGVGNWQDLRYETVDVVTLLSSTNDFIFMEGGDDNANAMEAFLDVNLPAIEAWVSNGGSLILNAAPNVGDGMNFGFGGVALTYPDESYDLSVAAPGHSIFTGPNLPTGDIYCNFGAHGIICPPGMTALLTQAGNNKVVLAETSWGSGNVIFGGLPLPWYDDSLFNQPVSHNTLLNLIAYAGGQGATASNVAATAIDNCGEATVTYSDGEETGTCPVSFIRTWTATDECGNSTTCTQTITLVDEEAPTITCPAATEVSCDSSLEPISTGVPTADDNCNAVTFSHLDDPITDNCPQTLVRNWTATDACGNVSTCTQTITIVDNSPPIITCPMDATVSCDESLDPDNTGSPTAEDNCNAVTFTHEDGPIEGSCPQTFARTWTATDACGNESSCTQTITIEFDVPPVIECPATIKLICLDADTDPDIIGSATATSACGSATVSHEDGAISGDCPISFIRTWTATDDCGNTSTCDQTITLKDNVGPQITCVADATIQCGESSDPENTGGEATATDNCNGVEVSYSDGPISGVCPKKFIRTWTAVDLCGNASSCTQMITIEDETGPALECPNVFTVDCNNSDVSPDVTGYAVAEDPCLASLTYMDEDAGVLCGDGDHFVRTWIAVDECGNQTTCEQKIYVTDDTPPTITCPADTQVSCDESIDPIDTGEPTGVDDCNDVTFDYSDEFNGSATGSCAQILIRTWAATDACGNESTCEQTITVVDDAPPVLSGVPDDMTLNCVGINDPIVTATDNCDGELAVTTTVTSEPGECQHEFTMTITYTATDACGNVATDDFTIVSIDITAPVLDEKPDDLDVACDNVPEPPTITASGVDLCDINLVVEFSQETVPGICIHTYTLLRTWSVSDACGNIDSHTQTINVSDTENPVISCPADVVINCEEIETAILGEATATDNCGDPTITFEDGEITGDCPVSIIRTWTATDDCGNPSSCMQTITIDDEEGPTITCPIDATVSCANADTDPAITGEATATDNCGDPDITFEDGEISGSCPMTFTRTWIATDACGNATECMQEISIQDDSAPMTSSCNDISISVNEDGFTSLTETDLLAILGDVVDDCTAFDELMISVSPNSFSCDDINSTIPVTITVTDACNNSVECIADITIAGFCDDEGFIDLVPSLSIMSATINDIEPVAGILKINEIGGHQTDGSTVTVYVSNDSKLNFTWDPTLTSVAGTTVDNSIWDYAMIGGWHMFTSNNTFTEVSAYGVAKLGFLGMFDANNGQGSTSFTMIIDTGSGGELVPENNITAQIVDFFPE